jgi:hypothetical protein
LGYIKNKRPNGLRALVDAENEFPNYESPPEAEGHQKKKGQSGYLKSRELASACSLNVDS